MKRLAICTLLGGLLLPITTFAGNDVLTIINHFDQDLNFIIHLNPEVLPDYSPRFTLPINQQASSKVVDIQKETYIRVEDNDKHSAYWGVDIVNQQVKIHGYLSTGIAYSWKQQTVIFCTPEVYKQHRACV